jgi:L-alanine-DL-glutamate epimerase-like enolase superfamily enzyme
LKITRVSATAESRRRSEPLRDALQSLDTQGTCTVMIETDEGITGHGSIFFGRLDAAPAILAQLIDDELVPAILGEDPFMVRGVRDKLWRLTDYHGTVG